MAEEQKAGKIFLFCKESSQERIMKCLRDAFDVPGSAHDTGLELHNGNLNVTLRIYCESAGDEEQELVSRIHNLDKQRAGVTADIADVLNRDVNDLKLPNLITMLSARPAEQQALADSHDRLQAAVRGLKRVNEQNSELLNSALEMVEFEMNLLQASKAAPETANYNRGAYNAGDTMGVIDHGFDAKQ